MKKILSLAIFFVIAVTASAQNTKDSLMSVMVKDVCADIATKDLTNMDQDQLELELGMMMLPLFSKYEDAFTTTLNIDITDPESMNDFGKELGMKLVVECPAFIKLFAERSQKQKAPVEDKSALISFQGKLEKVTPGEVSYISVKDEFGNSHKLLWMGKFDGEEILNDKKNINKNIRVAYTETEVYNSKIKAYVRTRVIAGMSLID